MAKEPKNQEPIEGDAGRGDEILKRMLKTKPKMHKDIKKGSKKVRQDDQPKGDRLAKS